MPTLVGIKASHGLTGRLLTIPGAPAAVFAHKSAYISATSTSNTITWTAPTNNGNGTVSDYKLEHWNGSVWATIYTGPLLTFTHTAVNETATCFYRVSATNELGYGTTRQVNQSIVTRFTGSTTFAVPSTTNRVAILCVGGGSGSDANRGGGGGGIALSYGVSVTPSSSITYAVGSFGSGSGAFSGNPSGNGGTSSVTIGSVALNATGGVISSANTRGGSSGAGTVSQGTSIFTSVANLGGTTSSTTFGGSAYVPPTTLTGYGGGAGAGGVGANGTSSTTTARGGNGGASRTFFGLTVSRGGGGYGSTSSGTTSASSSGGGAPALGSVLQDGQSGVVAFLYFS